MADNFRHGTSPHRKATICCNQRLYREGNRIERMIGHLQINRAASLNWQPNAHSQTLWKTVHELDAPMVQVDNAARNRETQAETAGIRAPSQIESVEGIKGLLFF